MCFYRSRFRYHYFRYYRLAWPRRGQRFSVRVAQTTTFRLCNDPHQAVYRRRFKIPTYQQRNVLKDVFLPSGLLQLLRIHV